MAKAYVTLRSNIVMSDQLASSAVGTIGANFQNAKVEQHSVGPGDTLTLTPPTAWKSVFISSADGVFTLKDNSGGDMFVGSIFLVFNTETQLASAIEVASIAGCTLSVIWDLA